MASGIAVSTKCEDAFTALDKREYSRIVLKINKDMTMVDLDKTYPPVNGDPEAEWKTFIKSLPENEARYIISDFSWKETPTVVKSKIVMILWSPDYAPIRSKMIYASSLEAVNTKIRAQKTIQATEMDELEYPAMKSSIAK